jgi:hypothetical protein
MTGQNSKLKLGHTSTGGRRTELESWQFLSCISRHLSAHNTFLATLPLTSEMISDPVTPLAPASGIALSKALYFPKKNEKMWQGSETPSHRPRNSSHPQGRIIIPAFVLDPRHGSSGGLLPCALVCVGLVDYM